MSLTLAAQPWCLGLLDFFQRATSTLERWRIQKHLRIVERELTIRNTSHLSPRLKAERQRNIEHLHDYWTAGVFPKNMDFCDRRVPYFKDAAGVPCAMAYLIEESGYQALVQEVASTNNHVYISDIKSGPVLDWLGSEEHTSELQSQR